MASKLERIIGIGERLIATGRTRLLATLVTIGSLVYCFRIDVDPARRSLYAILIVVAQAVFIIAKTIGDVKEGPAHDGPCKKTDDTTAAAEPAT